MGSVSESKCNLIIVSNRLPLSIKRVDSTYQSSLSSGGLVTSLSGLTKSTAFRWFGWPGIEVKDLKDRAEVSKSLDEHRAIPIFLDSDLAHEHYNSFSSKFDWLCISDIPASSLLTAQTEFYGQSFIISPASSTMMAHGRLINT